jgi:hypothetical protein
VTEYIKGALTVLVAIGLALLILWIVGLGRAATCIAARDVKFAFEACVKQGATCFLDPADIRAYSDARWALNDCE